MKTGLVSRLIWLGVVTLCLLAFITCLLILLSPFEMVSNNLDRLSPDGQVEFFTIARHMQWRSWAMVLGPILCLFLVTGIFLRTRIQENFERIFLRVGKFFQIFCKDWRDLSNTLLERDSESFTIKRIYFIALLFITFLAAVMRLAYLFAPIRYDEAYSYLVFAMQPVRSILTDYHVPNNHFLHTLSMRMISLLLGNQIWALRLPVFLAGVLLVPATYLTGALVFRKRTNHNSKEVLFFDDGVFNRLAGLLASALVAVSTVLIEFSTNARGYMFICFFTMTAIWIAVYLKENYNLAAWSLLAVVSAAGFFTIPIFLYPYGMVMGWLLLDRFIKDTHLPLWKVLQHGRFLRAWLVSGLATVVITLVLYLPLLVAGGKDDLLGNRFVSAVEAVGFSESILARIRASWADWERGFPVLVMILLTIGCITAFLFSKRLSGSRVPLPLVGLAWISFVIWLQRVTPWPRIWIFLLPVFFVWAAGGLAGIVEILPPLRRLSSKVCTGFLVGGICAFTVILAWNVYRYSSILDASQTWNRALSEEHEIAIFLSGELADGDVVGTSIPVNYPLRYYLLLEGVSQDVIFRKTQDAQFKRALVVVHGGYGQTLGDVLKKTKLDEFIRQDQAGLIHEYQSSQVYEINHR